MKCPECQFENHEEGKFCIKCGGKLVRTCPQCGNTLLIEAIFCDKCGQKLDGAVEAEKKSPTIYSEVFNMTKVNILNGADRGKSFEIRDKTIYIGRSPDNNVQIEDITVSRRHLKIIRNAGRYFVIDLESNNGTFVDGAQIRPGIEFEVKEGMPIIIGMSMICLGATCPEYDMPFLDSIDLSTEFSENDRVSAPHRTMTVQKNIELICKVNNVLSKSLNLDKILKKILDGVLDLLRRIDRGAIILIDNGSEKISKIVCRSRNTRNYTAKSINRHVVYYVIKYKKAVFVLNHHHNGEEANLSGTLKLSQIGSTACVPLIFNSHIMGAIYFDSLEKPYGFRKEDLSLLTDLSNRAAIAIENTMLYENLEEKGEEEGKISKFPQLYSVS